MSVTTSGSSFGLIRFLTVAVSVVAAIFRSAAVRPTASREATDADRSDQGSGERMLLMREQRARVDAEVVARRWALLANAGRMFAESRSYYAALAGIASLMVPDFADWCAIDLLDEDGVLRQVAFVHAHSERASVAGERRQRLGRGEGSAAHNALASGRSAVYAGPTDSTRPASTAEEHERALLRELRVRSSIVTPLVARGRSIGALTLMLSDSDRDYGSVDLAHADELARLCAAAVDNARLYAAAQAEREEARAADRAKDEFLATVSHELRTPLNAVLGWTRLLQGGALDAATRDRALATIERNARIQAQLVEDLLDVSRVTSGKLRLVLVPVDLARVIEESIESVRPTAQAKHIQLLPVLDRRAASIVGDFDRLRQVLWNLLSNAVKFTPEGGRVEVRSRRSESQVEISVRDTGIGIRAEFLPYVFDRFRQADSSATRTYGGLGLGLTIVRHLVELHGGSVRVESGGTGKGAHFIVSLPVEARTAQQKQCPSPPNPSRSARAQPEP